MKKVFSIIISGLTYLALVRPPMIFAQSPAPFRLNITNTVGAYMEIPFHVVATPGKQLNLSTGWTYGCTTMNNILTDTITLGPSNCYLWLNSDIRKFAPSAMPTNEDWKRNYNGVFSEHVITVNGQNRLISFDHGENKNENINGALYQNTVDPSIKASDCASGWVNGAYQDCWSSYNAFVNLSWQVLDAAHGYGMENPVEEGPIIWPENGYYQNGVKVSHGLRHPHGLIDNGYMYVFYNDTSDTVGGQKVARAPVSSGGQPGSFNSYCNGSWVPSLPAGFDKNRMKDFYDKKGGCASRIIPLDVGQISFAAAKKTTGGYLGIEEVSSNQATKINLYQSNNLTDWTFIKTVNQTVTYADNKLHYPIFLNSAGTTNELVDPSNFYILGASGGYTWAMSVSLTTPTPTPTIAQKPGDLNGDGKVDIFDYNIIVSNFNKPYTIFDYNTLVGNFGK